MKFYKYFTTFFRYVLDKEFAYIVLIICASGIIGYFFSIVFISKKHRLLKATVVQLHFPT
jgi:hypothetical protein